MNGIIYCVLGIMGACIIFLIIMFSFMYEWVEKADKDIEMNSFNIESLDKRVKSLEVLNADVERSVQAEVYRQLNMRELDK